MRYAAAALLLAMGSVEAIDNGYGLLPPMGWRSWNCYHGNVNQRLMEKVMDAMVTRNLTVGGKPTSLADLGFIAVGLDDNWQACGTGVNGSFHDSEGHPLVNLKTFPDMKGMTQYGQRRGLRVGWYANNCICKETQFHDKDYIAKHMQAMATAAADFGFDGIKLDGCGQFRDLTWWAKLLNATGRHIMIENCHWGQTVPGQTSGDGPCTGTTDISNCPYNFYRTSGDIRAEWTSMFSNLQTTTKFQGDVPLSRPGAWAYPDMLEVGNLASFEEDRSHFGAWVITSSPLVLGYDVTNLELTRKVWPIISNREVLAVSQTWAGHPGRLVKSSPTSGTPEYQVWAKVLGNNKYAVFFMSNSGSTVSSASVTLQEVGITASSASVRDLYEQKDIGAVRGVLSVENLKSHDSRMFILSA